MHQISSLASDHLHLVSPTTIPRLASGYTSLNFSVPFSSSSVILLPQWPTQTSWWRGWYVASVFSSMCVVKNPPNSDLWSYRHKLVKPPRPRGLEDDEQLLTRNLDAHDTFDSENFREWCVASVLFSIMCSANPLNSDVWCL